MYLMYADEADQDGAREYLIYGAVFIPSENALALHKEIERIRFHHGFGAGDALKFATGTKPKAMGRDDHTSAKNAVLEAAYEHQCVACCYVTPHSIAKGQPHENRLKFGLNTLLVKFNEFLSSDGGQCGMAFIDGSKDYHQDAYFREVFNHGLKFSKARKKLHRILAIQKSCDGQSHFSSLADVVVGSFRFVFNEPDKDHVGSALLKQLARLMWARTDAEGIRHLRDRGLCIRPKNIEHFGYEADIQATIDRLKNYLS